MGRVAVGVPLTLWVVILALMLGGCSDPWAANPPAPKMVCTKAHVENYTCGRGDSSFCQRTVCEEGVLACPNPLVIRESLSSFWGTRTMECRLKN